MPSRYVLELEDGREIMMGPGVDREDIEEMLDQEGVVDEDGRHHLNIARHNIARIIELE